VVADCGVPGVLINIAESEPPYTDEQYIANINEIDDIMSIVNVKGKAMEIANTEPKPGSIPKINPNTVPTKIASNEGTVKTVPITEKR